jgi:hypothetical protein
VLVVTRFLGVWWKCPVGISAQAGLRRLESVRKVFQGLQSFRSMSRIDARRRKASAFRVRFAKSLHRRRQRFSQAKVRSTTHRRGSTLNPPAASDRLTISTSSYGNTLVIACANCGP